MGRNTHPSDASGELDNRVGTTSPSEPDQAWNQPATTSLVLGILAVVIQLVPWGVWIMLERQGDAASARVLAGGLLRTARCHGVLDLVLRLSCRGYRRHRVRRGAGSQEKERREDERPPLGSGSESASSSSRSLAASSG